MNIRRSALEYWTRRIWFYQIHRCFKGNLVLMFNKFYAEILLPFFFQLSPHPVSIKVVAHLLYVQSHHFFEMMSTHDNTQRSIRYLLFPLPYCFNFNVRSSLSNNYPSRQSHFSSLSFTVDNYFQKFDNLTICKSTIKMTFKKPI